MEFEEWWKDYVKPASIYTIQQTAKDAWEAAFEEGYKFANKENEEYDKTLTGERAV